MLCFLYRFLCRRLGPQSGGVRLTLSAYAWVVFQKTGNSRWRDRIDGWWLLRYGERDHCQSSYQLHQRDTA